MYKNKIGPMLIKTCKQSSVFGNCLILGQLLVMGKRQFWALGKSVRVFQPFFVIGVPKIGGPRLQPND